jgi:glycosyltransferase involved in cell wall biosynthesis
MRLLYTLTSYPPAIGGAQYHQHMLAIELSRKHDIQVVCQWDTNRTDWLLGTTLRGPSESRDYKIDGIPAHRIGLSVRERRRLVPWVLLYYPLMGRALPRIAATLQSHIAPYAAEVDLIHNMRIGREGLSVASLRTARSRGVPFVFTAIHHPRWTGWRYRAYTDLYRSADILLALTNAEKRVLSALGVQEDRIHVVGMGPVLAVSADARDFLGRHGIQGPTVLFLGQHYPYKGYRQVLGAARQVWRRVPDASFVFVGPPVGRSEAYFAAGSDHRIHRLGSVDLHQKTSALASCDLLCVPSTQESFGGVYTEAWSFGKPVIGCRIPAVSEVIDDGIDGFLVRQDSLEIADRIVYLLEHPDESKAMGEAGRRKVFEKYTWQRVAERVELAYEAALHVQ